MPEFNPGRRVRVTIDAVIADSYEDELGKRHVVIQFQTDRRRLLEFPAAAQSVSVEAVPE